MKMQSSRHFSPMNSFIRLTYDCGMFEINQNPYLACSSDSIALIDLTKINLTHDVDVYALVKLAQHTYASQGVKIRGIIVKNTVGNVLFNNIHDIPLCRFGDETSKRFVPYEHAEQVRQQMIELNVNFFVYVKATELFFLTHYLPMHQDLSCTNLVP